MKPWIAGLALSGVVLASALAVAQPAAKPTIVLVHGAFADSSSWNGVVGILEQHGYRVVAVANPLRSVKTDAAYAQGVIASIKTPIVLVGHSYGGMVITHAASGQTNVKALVYVAAFAPDVGETAGGLDAKFSGLSPRSCASTAGAAPGWCSRSLRSAGQIP
jgi:pimeloyl-ACP methyl ester carboxylesterase